MGLDNGIIVKNADKYMKKVPFWAYDKGEYDKESNELYVVYWRKNYYFRHTVLEIIKPAENMIKIPMTVENVVKIRKYLKSMMNYKKFGGSMVGILDYVDARPIIARQITNLWWLIRYMKRHKDTEVYFLDSY